MAAYIAIAGLKEVWEAEKQSQAAAREKQLSRLLVTYIATGLSFMLLPGTFLGVWNLLTISSHRAVETASAGWIQAHGHAQIFGWIGTFILGIGYYSIPKLRRVSAFGLWTPWTSWALWTAGVSMRWLANVYEWHWRVLLPVSAVLELTAFLIFFAKISGHKSAEGKAKLDHWILVVVAGCLGWLATLLINLMSTFFLAWQGMTPVLPHGFDQRLLTLETWGFLVPFVWGFSARWLPVFLGLRAPRESHLLHAVLLNSAGVLAALVGWTRISVLVLLLGLSIAIYALEIFSASIRPAKTSGVHSTFPVFVRLAYAWALIAAGLAIWAAFTATAPGIWGASRHALTVGFFALMVFATGQRVLPAFAGMKLLFSSRLMFWGLLLLTIGCALRVVAQIIAYQGFASTAWALLPVSAVIEMTAVTIFALNLAVTFVRPRSQAAGVPVT